MSDAIEAVACDAGDGMASASTEKQKQLSPNKDTAIDQETGQVPIVDGGSIKSMPTWEPRLMEYHGPIFVPWPTKMADRTPLTPAQAHLN